MHGTSASQPPTHTSHARMLLLLLTSSFRAAALANARVLHPRAVMDSDALTTKSYYQNKSVKQ